MVVMSISVASTSICEDTLWGYVLFATSVRIRLQKKS